MGLRRTVEPVADAITITTAKKQCEIASTDTAHDVQLQRFIAAAVRDVERHTGRALCTQTWELTLSEFPACPILLPRPPFQSITSIQYVDSNGDTQTLSSSLYAASTESPSVLQPVYGQVWPTTQPGTRAAVIITYVAGFGPDSTYIPPEYQSLLAELVLFRFGPGRGDVVNADIPKHIRAQLQALRCGVSLGSYGVRR